MSATMVEQEILHFKHFVMVGILKMAISGYYLIVTVDITILSQIRDIARRTP